MSGGTVPDNEQQTLNIVTQETRFVLLQNTLGHPQELPSLKELAYVNPSKSEGTIYEHLRTLVDHGVVGSYELPKDERSRDLSYKFYGVTESGRAFLQQYGMLRAEETLHEAYEAVEKPTKIADYENAPRPLHR
jgi:hypothetical protein